MRTGSEAEDKGITVGIGVRGGPTTIVPAGSQLIARPWLRIQPDDNAANAAVLVGASGSTGEAGNTTATVYDSTGAYRQLTTTAVSGNAAGWAMAGSNGPTMAPNTGFMAHLKTGADITNVRFWIALSQTSLTGASAPGNQSMIGFRFATDQGDTNWMMCESNVGGFDVQATSVPVAINTSYYFQVSAPLSGFSWIVNGVPQPGFPPVTHQPNGNLQMSWTMAVTTLTTASKTINCGFFEIDHL